MAIVCPSQGSSPEWCWGGRSLPHTGAQGDKQGTVFI